MGLGLGLGFGFGFGFGLGLGLGLGLGQVVELVGGLEETLLSRLPLLYPYP